MTITKHKKGEVWKVSDRHGNMTIKLLENVDESKDMFFKAKILDGNKKYISDNYNLMQKMHGQGTTGTIDSFRTGLCRFVEQTKEKKG